MEDYSTVQSNEYILEYANSVIHRFFSFVIDLIISVVLQYKV